MSGISETLEYVENKTFDEIAVGDSDSLSRTLKLEDIQMFAVMSGDVNPALVDPDYARSSMYHGVVVPGMFGGALISGVLGTQFPGPGTILVEQSMHFSRPAMIGDTVTVTLTCKEKNSQNKRLIFDCLIVNQSGEKVTRGTAEVIAPTEKIKRQRIALPDFKFSDKQARYERFLGITKGLSAIKIGVAYPCDIESLKGALMARDAGLIVPTLIGDEYKMRSVAEQLDMTFYDCTLVNIPDSVDAAEHSVKLARSGEVEALMKGSLHTHELMSVVMSKEGLRTTRRISHVFLMDVPAYPRPLMITDAAVNIEPDLETKVDIIQNAIDLAHMLGTMEPKVAILAAVETVNPKMISTLEAAALCKMADRGQIKGGVLDGPLAFDNAVSMAAAKTKGIKSPVAGQADILIMPDIESGNMVAKQLEYLADALSAGIVLGAKLPIVLTSRADKATTRTASTAVAVVIAHAKRKMLGN